MYFLWKRRNIRNGHRETGMRFFDSGISESLESPNGCGMSPQDLEVLHQRPFWEFETHNKIQTTWLWSEKSYPKQPIGPRKNRPKHVVCRGGYFWPTSTSVQILLLQFFLFSIELQTYEHDLATFVSSNEYLVSQFETNTYQWPQKYKQKLRSTPRLPGFCLTKKQLVFFNRIFEASRLPPYPPPVGIHRSSLSFSATRRVFRAIWHV